MRIHPADDHSRVRLGLARRLAWKSDPDVGIRRLKPRRSRLNWRGHDLILAAGLGVARPDRLWGTAGLARGECLQFKVIALRGRLEAPQVALSAGTGAFVGQGEGSAR